MKQGWEIRPFEKSIEKVKYTTKIATCDYSTMGAYPVVSQEEEYISGYWNNVEDVFKVSKPVVIFGDHTRVLKYVDFDFVLGADGVKILQPIDAINAKFFLYYLIASKIPSLGYSRHYKLLKELNIPVPPIAEQEKIVAELDCLSGIIEKKKQQLKELDNLAQSIFYEMFGDPVENDKGWDIYALSKNVKVKGRVGWKGYKKEDLRDSGPLAIGGGHLTDSGGIDLSSPVFLSMEKYLESPEIMIEVGDIILVQRGTIGKVGLIANDIGMATINPCVLILRPENLNAIYLLHYFLNQSTQTHLKTLIKGVAQPMITQQQVNGLLLPIPPLYLQQDFASKIESVEKQKELISQSIKETETLFNSRMDYYFN